MTKKSISLYLFFVLYCVNLSAQVFQAGEISGKITDLQSNPVSFASVILRNSSDSSVYKTAITGKEGMFSLSRLKSGNYFAEVKLIGFETLIKRNLSVDETSVKIDLGVLKLQNSAIMLSGVTIKAKTPFIESRADKIIVNMDNDIIGQGSAIMDIMDRLPGVRVSPEEQINLNGKSVTIYIDGKATPLSGDALKGLLKGMSSSNIQRIELIANPSSKYDAAGSGGIINIVRKRNTKDGLIGSVYGGIQQWNNERNNAGLILNYKGKAFNVFINADYAYNKYFMDANLVSDVFFASSLLNTRSLSEIRSVRNSRSVTPSYGIDFYVSKKTTLSLSGIQSWQSFNKLGNTNLDELDGGLVKTKNYNFINNVATKSLNYSSNLHLLHQIDSTGKELTIDLDYSNYDSNSGQDNSDTRNDASGNFISVANSVLDQDMNWNIYAAKADYSQRLKDGNLETGWKSSYVVSKNNNAFYNVLAAATVTDPSKNDQFNYSENINAFYFNFNKKYNKFSFQSGLRAEHTFGKGEQRQNGESFNKRYVQLFPSLALDYKLTADHSINAHFNKRINRPTYENLNPLIRIINSSNYTGGNPGLKPVISYNSSIGYAYKSAFFATLSYNISLHDNMSLTVPYDTNGTTIRKPGNNRYSEYFNLFLIWSKKFASWHSSNYDVSFYKQTFKSNADNYNLSSTGIPSVNFNTYQNFNLNKKLSFQLLFKYQGKYEERSRTTQPNYYVIAGVRRTIFGTRGSISANMSDVFNTYNSHYLDNSSIIRQDWENIYDVRLIRANFTYNFGKGKIKKVNSGTGAADEKNRGAIKEN
jgi:hypothetical protein